MQQLDQHSKRQNDDTTSRVKVSKLQERLKNVQSRLKQQSLEQKKREEAMRLIKRDSERCKQLEASILQLKKMKADTMKKQKEAAARYRTLMEIKNKELADMRKKSRREKKHTSKLESENRKLQTAYMRKAKAHQKVPGCVHAFLCARDCIFPWPSFGPPDVHGRNWTPRPRKRSRGTRTTS